MNALARILPPLCLAVVVAGTSLATATSAAKADVAERCDWRGCSYIYCDDTGDRCYRKDDDGTEDRAHSDRDEDDNGDDRGKDWRDDGRKRSNADDDRRDDDNGDRQSNDEDENGNDDESDSPR